MKTKPPLIPRANSEAGFTIIESLLAVIVVGILIVAIGPVIALSAATRIQARRVDWATQAARAYLDGIRSDTIAPPPVQTIGDRTKDKYVEKLKDIAAPTAGSLTCEVRSLRKGNNGTDVPYTDARSGYCTAPTPGQSALYCVDGDNDGECTNDNLKDFVVQASGVQNDSTTANAKRGYFLGIRVYRADGFADSVALKTDEQAKTFSGGFGDRKAPVLITITEIIGSDTTYQNLKNQFE